jgi:hypothetical protein
MDFAIREVCLGNVPFLQPNDFEPQERAVIRSEDIVVSAYEAFCRGCGRGMRADVTVPNVWGKVDCCRGRMSPVAAAKPTLPRSSSMFSVLSAILPFQG